MIVVDGQTHSVEIWVPPERGAERTSYFLGAAAFVVTFSVASRASFVRARTLIQAEVAPYVESEVLQVGSPPVLLVGTGAELRRGRASADASQVPADEAVQVSQRAGLSRYLEVDLASPSHVQTVFSSTVADALGAAKDATGSYTRGKDRGKRADAVAYARRRLRELREHLVLPEPTVTLDLASRTCTISSSSNGAHGYGQGRSQNQGQNQGQGPNGDGFSHGRNDGTEQFLVTVHDSGAISTGESDRNGGVSTSLPPQDALYDGPFSVGQHAEPPITRFTVRNYIDFRFTKKRKDTTRKRNEGESER